MNGWSPSCPGHFNCSIHWAGGWVDPKTCSVRNWTTAHSQTTVLPKSYNELQKHLTSHFEPLFCSALCVSSILSFSSFSFGSFSVDGFVSSFIVLLSCDCSIFSLDSTESELSGRVYPYCSCNWICMSAIHNYFLINETTLLHRMQILHTYSKQHGQEMPCSLVSYI